MIPDSNVKFDISLKSQLCTQTLPEVQKQYTQLSRHKKSLTPECPHQLSTVLDIKKPENTANQDTATYRDDIKTSLDK